MVPPLNSAIQITIIGMLIVFAVILVLWFVMGLIVRLTPDDGVSKEEIIIVSSGKPSDAEMKKMAAIAAVTVALARQKDASQPHPFPLPPTSIVSAWQAVLRSRMLTKRGQRQ
jgi:Na+-transporting methylmalonyl-CoA/oxaloacetate decarboxylase gamma subunit